MYASIDKTSILSEITPEQVVLDLGGGKGLYWQKILNKYPELNLIFFEPDFKELEIAKKNLSGQNIKFIQDLSYVDGGSIDVIYSFSALEHVWDFNAYFEQIKRVLSKNGSCFIHYDDGHFRNYLYLEKSIFFQFKNWLKTKMYFVWKVFKVYRKYQYPVNPENLYREILKNNLKIVDEYYLSINGFKNLQIVPGLDLQDSIITKLHELQLELNLNYKNLIPSELRFRSHGSLWKIMGSRCIKICIDD